MILFKFYTRDISSDAGYVEILVFAESAQRARIYLKVHLESINRVDLIDKMEIVNYYGVTPGVISSNVETRCDS